MAQERTLFIIKPDAVRRGLVGEILSRVERKGYSIEEMKMMKVNRELAGKLYLEHEGKPFYEKLISYITSGEVVAVLVSGERCISGLRRVIGKTDPIEAAPGSIRGDFGFDGTMNLVHASDSAESAEREIQLFFGA